MINIGIGIGWAKAIYSVANNIIADFKARVLSYPGSIFEAGPCLDATLEGLNAKGLLDNASLVITPNAYNEGILYGVVPNTTLGDMNVVRTTAATRVNSSGLIETVGLNIPRIDYTNGSCPSILVEPQRTNRFFYSEQFDNSYWNKGAIGGVAIPVVTPNDSISPNGTTSADKVVFPSVSAGQASTIFKGFVSSDRNFTQSFYIKGLLGTEVIWIAYTIDKVNFISKICNLTTDWKRFDLSALIPTEYSSITIGIDTRDSLQTARPAQTVFLWGAQLEIGAYSTSYIPTVASTVTRNADLTTRNNIYTNNLITSLGGTWFIELNNNVSLTRDVVGNGIWIGDNSTISTIGNSFNIRHNGGTSRLSINKAVDGTLTGLYVTLTNTVKIAINWNGATADVFVNGVKIKRTSFTATNMEFLNSGGGRGCVPKYIKSTMLFPSPLTDAECIALTTL